MKPDVKINTSVIAQTALSLLDETGLDGLTMRRVADKLGVQPGALYWHVKSKQELLDAMASAIFADAAAGLEAPRASMSWQDWLSDWARQLRRAMLRYQDGAKVFAGASLQEPAVFRATELALRTLEDGGFAVRPAARSVATLLHYTVGFTMEEQAHTAAKAAGGAGAPAHRQASLPPHRPGVRPRQPVRPRHRRVLRLRPGDHRQRHAGHPLARRKLNWPTQRHSSSPMRSVSVPLRVE